MWAIYYETNDERNSPLASWTNNKDDILDAQFSLFRGPNRIIWKTHSGKLDLMLKAGKDVRFWFGVFDTGDFVWKIEVTLEKLRWDSTTSLFEITFIPTLFQLMSIPIEGIVFNSRTIKDILESIYPNARIAIGENMKNDKMYNGFNTTVSMLDYLAKFAKDTNSEMCVTDRFVGIGELKDNTDDFALYEIRDTFNNTHAQVRSNGKIFRMFAYDQAPQYPGSYMMYENTVQKIVYTRLYWGPVKATSLEDGKAKEQMVHAFEASTWSIDPDILITEYELAELLEENDKMILKSKIYTEQFINSYISNIVEDEEETEKYGLTDTYMKDMAKLDGQVFGDIPEKIYKASPYAGKKVGLQFPANIDSHDVIIAPNGDRSSATSVAQIWQDNSEVPSRKSINDMRWTFPDGSTIYYDNESHSIFLIAKTKVFLGVDGNIAYNKDPTSVQQGIVIDRNINGNITIDAGPNKVIISGVQVEANGTSFLAKALHKHLFSHSHATPAGPSGPPVPLLETNPCTDNTTKLTGG